MNRIDLAGRLAVVTGGAKGLGRAIVDRFLQSGARVAVWDISSKDLEGFEKHPNMRTAVVNVCDEAAVANSMQAAANWAGAVDILVNSAGIGGPFAPIHKTSLQDWEQVFAVNVVGTFLCCRAAIPLMIKANYGRIVNLASVAGKEGNANTGAYSATKAAVISLTKSLGKELARTGITANCITPAAVRTAILANRSEEHVRKMTDKIPMGRFGLPEEIAAMAAWIASEDASFSTGAVFDISGGRATY